jgi:hypothetical protein
VRGRRVLASAYLEGVPPESLLSSLRDGLTSEIVFQFRLYREQKGLGSLFGDRLIREETIVRQAGLDVFDRDFIMRSDRGEFFRFQEGEAFARQFFRMEGCDLGELAVGTPVFVAGEARSSRGAAPAYYILARIRYSPVRLVPPLNIISLFTRRTAVITRWVEAQLAPVTERGPGEPL